MKNKYVFTLSALLVLGGVLIWGCQGPRPLAPNKFISMSFSIPVSREVRASMLGAPSDEILYRVRGMGIQPVGGVLGPFSSASNSGTIDFAVDVPAGSNEVLSLQLNDASTHKALAVGAADLDFTAASPVTDVTINMGSVIRNCYITSFPTTLGGTYGFGADVELSGQITWGPAYDVAFSNNSGSYDMVDARTGNTASIAFVGNGNLVDFDYVPTNDYFSTDSFSSKNYVENLQAPAAPTPTVMPVSTVITYGAIAVLNNYYLQVGDIYCLKLGSIPGGHAWIQITSLGTPGVSGPIFCFRTNSILPYFAYQQTAPDVANACSTLY